MDLQIRMADPQHDAAAVADIYRPVVEMTMISFEEVAPTAAEMAERMTRTLERTPWLVAALGDDVVGYAYASAHRERAGYRWSVDLTAYIRDGFRGQRIGRTLYDRLVSMLRQQGFANAYAGIGLPNPASVALHEAIGMRLIGVYERVGWKLCAWHDVVWYGMRLAEPATDADGSPGEPRGMELFTPPS